jgi:hypothetical protein
MFAESLTPGCSLPSAMVWLSVWFCAGPGTASKPKYDSGGKTEVVLVVVDRIGEVREKVVGLDWTDCMCFPREMSTPPAAIANAVAEVELLDPPGKYPSLT